AIRNARRDRLSWVGSSPSPGQAQRARSRQSARLLYQSLEGTDGHSGGKGSIGRRGAGASLLRRPERIGVQALAKALVSGNCRLDQLPSGHPLLTQIARDLDQRTG